MAALIMAGLMGCAPDLAHHAIKLEAPYRELPRPQNGVPIEAGQPIALSPVQTEAIIFGVSKWLKQPRSARFGEIWASRNSRGFITACGLVDAENSAGKLVGPSPFIGVLRGSLTEPEFVVVEIGTLATDRSIVAGLCRESGISGIS